MTQRKKAAPKKALPKPSVVFYLNRRPAGIVDDREWDSLEGALRLAVVLQLDVRAQFEGVNQVRFEFRRLVEKADV